MQLERKLIECIDVKKEGFLATDSRQPTPSSEECGQHGNKYTDIQKETLFTFRCDNHHHSNRQVTLTNSSVDISSVGCDNRLSDNEEYPRSSVFLWSTETWPLVVKEGVVINLVDLSIPKLSVGDIYFYLKQDESGQIALWVKYCLAEKVIEKCVPESMFGCIFSMDWLEEFPMESTKDIGESLHSCLVILEDSIEKLRWQDIVPYIGQKNRGKVRLKQSQINSPRVQSPSSVRSTKTMKDLQNSCVKCDKLSESAGSFNIDKGSNSFMLSDKRSLSNSEGELLHVQFLFNS